MISTAETEKPHEEQTNMDEDEEREPPTENVTTQWKTVTAKRPHQTDSDSEPVTMPRKQRSRPKPNVKAARHVKKNADHTKKS